MVDGSESGVRPSGKVLESGVRLSESLLWNLQRAYYIREGIEAWKSGTVPSYITTNAFIARSYAHVIHAFLIDRARLEGEGCGKVTLLELGAGHGRFGYLVLKQLLELTRNSLAPVAPFRYVMTDLVEKNIRFWQLHDLLTPLVKQGVLDFAQFDVERAETITLLESGEVITADNPTDSTVLIANYIFDSLAVDVFQVEDGVLRERRISLRSDRPDEPDLEDPDLISRIEVEYDPSQTSDAHYDDPELQHILDTYQQSLGDTAFLMPVGALATVASVQRLTRGQLMVLSADKGYNHAHQLLGHSVPTLVRHGSFSFNVNYHAIGVYFRERGGFSLHTSERSGSIEVAAFLATGSPADHFHTCMAFQKEIEGFGPVDFFLLQRDAGKLEGSPTLEYCLSLLRLSGFDPEVFYDLRVPMREQAESAHPDTQQEVVKVLKKVWQLFYHLGSERDVPFAMGRICHRMSQFQHGLHYYQQSLRLFGDDRATLYNVGLCHYRLGQPATALHFFDKALEADPTYSYARDWKLRVLAEMRQSPTSWESEPLI